VPRDIVSPRVVEVIIQEYRGKQAELERPARLELLDDLPGAVTPMEDLTGRDAVLEAAKKLLSFIQSIEVRSKFESETQAMLAYDMHFARTHRSLPSGRTDDIQRRPHRA